MFTQIRQLIFMMVLLIVIAACANEIEPASETGSDSDPINVDARITPTVNVCDSIRISEIAFPRQESVDGPRAVMEAELVGDLVVSNGCLRVESLYHDGSYLPIWPPEFTLGLGNEIPVILDGEGNVVGRVGEEVYMGGGEGSERALPACVREQLPADCGGPFWIVGDGVRPNLQFESDLIQLELNTTTERTAILLHKKPILDDWVEEPSIISGILRQYNPQRCPRIQSESGITDYLPIWPPGYSIQMTDGLVEILDSFGEVVAQEGAEVILHGGAILHHWESEQYRQLYHSIPGDCFGPYWIVDELISPTPEGVAITPTPWIDIEYPPDTRTGIVEIDSVIDAILAQTIGNKIELVDFIQYLCTNEDGLGGPPKCEGDEPEGALIEAFPVLYSEGVHVRPDNLQSVFDFTVRGLFAVYRVPESTYETDYWPTGVYAVVFTSEDDGYPHTLTVHVTKGQIVRLEFNMDWPPFDFIWGKSDTFILPPSTR